MLFLTVVFASLVAFVSCDFGLINLLYWKADVNLDRIISKTELQSIWHDFDKNNDKKVTQSEFVPHWAEVTGHSREKSVAFFLLADLNDDKFIDQPDIDALYKLFDRNANGEVSAEEFSEEWQRIILDMPFAVLFEMGDSDKDDLLTTHEYTAAFLYLDTTHDRQLKEAEFSAAWMGKGFGVSHQASELFKHLDTNRDGVLNDRDFGQLFLKYDTSRDQKMSLGEMVKMASLLPPLKTNRLPRTSEIMFEVNMFDAVDVNNDTYLDQEELNLLFFSFDSNNDSRVSEIEFKYHWVVILRLGGDEQAATVFRRADATGDGVLTLQDMGTVFKYFDQDGDQKVYVGEFLTQWGALKLDPVNPDTVVIG